MGLNYEMTRYTELTGEDGTKVSISRLGGYLDGYEKGRIDTIEEFTKEIRKLWGGTKAMEEIEDIAKHLKELE